jgi:hypothetical protein
LKIKNHQINDVRISLRRSDYYIETKDLASMFRADELVLKAILDIMVDIGEITIRRGWIAGTRPGMASAH